jgi:integrase
MSEGGTRRLRDGRTVAVHRNGGLRKVCGCARRVWAKCPHPWHLNYRWKGDDYRLSLNRYAGKLITDKTAAEELAAEIKRMIRAGTFNPEPVPSPQPVDDERRGRSFDTVADIFVDQYSKARGKTSWADDQSMLRQVAAFAPLGTGTERLGAKSIEALTEEDLEAFLRHLRTLGRTTATLNHYVGLFRTVDRWLARKGYRAEHVLSGESAVIRKKKANQRNRRLEPKEEARLLAVAGPHLQRVTVAALETCCREGELLGLQWREVSLSRHEIHLPAEKTKTRTARTVPISDRLHAVLKRIRNGPDGKEHKPSAYVFGNEVGEQVKDVKRAWQTAVLKAHGHEPTWTWTKKTAKKGSGTLSADSRQAYRAIGLHFHDLRHEAGSRLLEAGWPLHEIQQMLGHANIQQTSTYLNATLQLIHRSMKRLDRTRRTAARRKAKSSPACKPLANTPACDPLVVGKGTPASDAKSLVN